LYLGVNIQKLTKLSKLTTTLKTHNNSQRMGAAFSSSVNYGFNDKTFITEGVEKYGATWSEKVGKTQTEHFREIVPDDDRELEQIMVDSHLDQFFTGDRFKKCSGFNAGHLYRQTTKMPDVIVFCTEEFIILHPMGEPGRDLGNTNYRMTHFMVVKRGDGNITFNEFLPSSPEELEDLRKRNEMIENAYTQLQGNTPLNQCGDMVIEKAESMGISTETGIRDFFIAQIMNLDEEFRGGQPGYKLLNSDGVDIAGNEGELRSVVEEVFSGDSGKVISCIQDPTRNTQLLSHIHTFRFNEGFGIPEEIVNNYTCTKTLYECKLAYANPLVEEGGGEGCGLSRQTSVMAR
tara:strand:- start:2697 stop:3737 length:1041 start_codon:yes stop_codon:yes gene_type:complete